MIKLQAQTKPVELTDSKVAELTTKYKFDGSSVWKQKYIEEALLLMSNNKCCYCECNITEESKYMEVDHFHPKKFYEDEVVLWDNLLPSCKHCNGCKGEHGTIAEPIINPINDNPQDHLILRDYRLYPKNGSTLGKTTIDEVDLNNRIRLQNKRYEIGSNLIEELENLLEKVKEYVVNNLKPNNKRVKITSWLEKLMVEGTAKSEYSATAATTLLNHSYYKEIKRLLLQENLWSQEFIDLELKVEYCSLDTGN